MLRPVTLNRSTSTNDSWRVWFCALPIDCRSLHFDALADDVDEFADHDEALRRENAGTQAQVTVRLIVVNN